MCRAGREFDALGARVVLAGQGSAEESAAFARDLRLPFVVLADPERAAYATYGLVEGTLGQLIAPAVTVAALRATLRGARQGPTVGAQRQLPGAFVIDRAGIVRFAKPARHAGDIASAEELLTAVRSMS